MWDADLEVHFIDAWVRSDPQTRALLTDIANWIDANLSEDPDLRGQEDSASVRILAVPVSAARVAVAYQILPEDRQVRVVRLVFRR